MLEEGNPYKDPWRNILSGETQPKVGELLPSEKDLVGKLKQTAEETLRKIGEDLKVDILSHIESWVRRIEEGYVTKSELRELLKELEGSILSEWKRFRDSTDIVPQEDLYSPPKLYAVKFDKQDDSKGAYLLLTHTEGIGLREGIFVVEEKDLRILDRGEIKYEKYTPMTNDVDEIYEHFGIERRNIDLEVPSLPL